VPALFTVCPPLNVAELLVKLPSPEYAAVTVWFPDANVEVLPELAVPDESVTGEPKFIPSIANCTVPVGVPVDGETAATLAVKLTDWPYVDGLPLLPTLTLLLAIFTVWPPVRVSELPVKFTSPEYVAVTVWFATDSVAVFPEVAVPDESVTGEPKFVPSIANCTVPLGVPVAGETAVTVAVNVTPCP
jgi:hypothetical protein